MFVHGDIDRWWLRLDRVAERCVAESMSEGINS